MDISRILVNKFPNTNWAVGETYDSLKWEDTSRAPTEDELKAYWIELQPVFVAEDKAVLYKLQNLDVLKQLHDLDISSIRAIRENDVERINEINNKAETLRAKLVNVAK